jgi:hypothetical protein
LTTETHLRTDHERAKQIFVHEMQKTLTSGMLEKHASSTKIADAIGVASSTIRMLKSKSNDGNFFTLASSFFIMGISVDDFVMKVSKRCRDEGIQWPAIN